MTRTVVTALFCIALCFLAVAHIDYRIAAAEAQMRAEQAAKRASGRDAPLWSKACERQGKRVLALQSDGGKWEIRCITGKVWK